MKILLVVATRSEIEPLLTRYVDPQNPNRLIFPTATAEVLITGVGMVATAYALGRHLALNSYDLAINAGIAGSFDFSISIGEVVMITEDIFAEQGAEDGEDFLSLDHLGFGEITQSAAANTAKIQSGILNLQSIEQIKKVSAITVNRVHGHEFSIAKTLSRFKAQVESMEGAAFFYASNQSQTPCVQIRSISNYVERRNKEKWNIGLAIKNLNECLSNLLVT